MSLPNFMTTIISNSSVWTEAMNRQTNTAMLRDIPLTWLKILNIRKHIHVKKEVVKNNLLPSSYEKGTECRVRENHLRDLCCHFSAVRANLMMDVSLKMESTNPNCQMVANVIKDTAQSEQPSNPTPLCPQSNLSELVRGDTPLRNPAAQSTHCLQTQLLLI